MIFTTIYRLLRQKFDNVAVPPAEPPAYRVTLNVLSALRVRSDVESAYRVRTSVPSSYRIEVDVN